MIISKPLSPSAICGNDHKATRSQAQSQAWSDGDRGAADGLPRGEHCLQPRLPNLRMLSEIDQRTADHQRREHQVATTRPRR